MMKVVNWVKANKVTSLLLLIVIYFVYKNYFGFSPLASLSLNSRQSVYSEGSYAPSMDLGASVGVSNSKAIMPPIGGGSDAATYEEERLVVTNSSLSLLVKDVREVGNGIIEYAKSLGGFMVQASYNRPTESPFATITVRVPSEELDTTLEHYRSLGIKVTNENLVGTDVTEQFVDIESRLETLNKTKAIFNSLLDRADTVEQLLKVQRELINLQSQVDSLVGQQKAIKENAAYARLTVYLSTDELALPYTPDETFRPSVIFKLAVRSLMRSLYNVGEGVIWLVVYSVIWIPVLLVYKFLKNRMQRNSS